LGEPSLAALFADDDERARRLSLEHEGLLLDYSKNLVTGDTLALLTGLADSVDLSGRIRGLFAGERVNSSEDRPALHMALRAPAGVAMEADGVGVSGDVHRVLDRMAEFCNAVRSGAWRGMTGRPIRHVVNLGIGGSDLGPRMAVKALRPYATEDLEVAFLANIDGADFAERVRGLDPAETLFVVCSKTFTTEETLANARAARAWLVESLGDEAAVARHFVAASANGAAAADFGIDPSGCFEFWDWVGGRYSLASSAGLSLMLGVGPEHFREMLAGMHAMDEHFRRAPFEANMPVLLGLLGVWYGGFFDAETHCIAPYSEALADFPAYLQQLEMESNGKRVGASGAPLEHASSPIVWGEPGTRSQHAFFQLLHQGTRLVPCDFIGFARGHQEIADHQDRLMAHCFAQTEALAFGHSGPPERACPGSRPSNTLLARQLTPAVLGQLVALYEHKVFVQATIWGVNPFDQWGVELGKNLARRILSDIQSGCEGETQHDASTRALIRRYLDERKPGG
jgi:glucose-6-phosphate isomerase